MSDEPSSKDKTAALRWALSQARQHARKWAKAADPSHSLDPDEQRLTTGLSELYDRHVAALHHLVRKDSNKTKPKQVYYSFFPKEEYDEYRSHPLDSHLSYSEWVDSKIEGMLEGLKYDDSAFAAPSISVTTSTGTTDYSYARFKDALLQYLNTAADGGEGMRRIALRDTQGTLILCIDTAFEGKLKIHAEISESGSKLTLGIDKEQAAWLRAIRIVSKNVWSTDSFMVEMLDYFTSNSEYGWINPSDTGDLTDAPMLGCFDEDGKVTERWAYKDYQVTNFLDLLADNGAVIFEN